MRFFNDSLIQRICAPVIRWLNGPVLRQLDIQHRQVESMMILQGRALALQNADRAPLDQIQDAEFKVFSQFGEDGILQYLIRETAINREEQIFIEFGVQDYSESNTRFLLQNDHWRGLIIDGSEEYMSAVRRSDLYWRNDLTALNAWIDRDNINDLISGAGFTGDIGVLSVDIDGNDYWVWERINVVSPIIVIAEWNGVFGPDHAVTVPYAADFNRLAAHYSGLYWGASIQALDLLAKRKGYSLVASNRAGNNLFFIRNDRLGRLRALTVNEAYVAPCFRESRDIDGNLTYLSGLSRYEVIKGMPVVDVASGQTTTLANMEIDAS